MAEQPHNIAEARAAALAAIESYGDTCAESGHYMAFEPAPLKALALAVLDAATGRGNDGHKSFRRSDGRWCCRYHRLRAEIEDLA